MLNILIAEDDPDDLQLFKNAIYEVLPHFNLLHAADGLECLELMDVHTPDIIFLDVSMPIKNGVACLKEIKSDPVLARVPVIMLSTSHEMEDVNDSYNNGATLYLVKPSNFKKLIIIMKGVFHMLGRPKKELSAKENFVLM